MGKKLGKRLAMAASEVSNGAGGQAGLSVNSSLSFGALL